MVTLHVERLVGVVVDVQRRHVAAAGLDLDEVERASRRLAVGEHPGKVVDEPERAVRGRGCHRVLLSFKLHFGA
jgi:hypothetical protein